MGGMKGWVMYGSTGTRAPCWVGKDQDEGAREPARRGLWDQPETGNTSQNPAKPPETSPGRARTVKEASYEGLRGPGRTMSTAIQQQGDQQRAGCRPSYGPQKGGLSGKSAEMPGGVHKGHEAVQDAARRYGSSTCRYRVGTPDDSHGPLVSPVMSPVRVGGIMGARAVWKSLGRRHARVPVKTASTDDGMIECFLPWWTKYPVQCDQAVTNTRARDEYSKQERVVRRRPICGHGVSNGACTTARPGDCPDLTNMQHPQTQQTADPYSTFLYRAQTVLCVPPFGIYTTLVPRGDGPGETLRGRHDIAIYAQLFLPSAALLSPGPGDIGARRTWA
ncbi:hypothetical protein OIDMADRAFT_30602 [Oidiodendron maius Zn]|uniref:Uncharacterized protein n=1 Tax=Oidiodendron maius (strain Zn) TaxID=913774 RepID=A0A0C3CIT4_OIDMZ|nr:hypothetical protein OIDMADRAFT_30602 [Oidiodendron maius Zn]